MKNTAKLYLVFLLANTLVAREVFGVRQSEEAAHKVIYEDGEFQVREYQAALMAVTTVKGDFKDSRNQAFKRLAGYIFGDNQTAGSIAMTAPVLEQKQSEKIAMTVPVFENNQDDEWTMTFVLPAEYTIETLPMPNNEQVKIIQAEKKTVAAIRYTGWVSPQSMKEKTQILQDWLKKKNYLAISQPYSAAYDPPWAIPFLRRNEMLIDIKIPDNR